MASHQLNGNAAAAIEIVVLMTLVSVMAQSCETESSGGCPFPTMSKSVSFVITKNVSRVDDSPDCFPISTELLYVCKDQETQQFSPSLISESLFIKCTGRGWLNGNGEKSDAPRCVNREEPEPILKESFFAKKIQEDNLFFGITSPASHKSDSTRNLLCNFIIGIFSILVFILGHV